MIIHKQQLDYRFPDGHMGKKLVVSYINKEHNVAFLQYPIPEEQMFEWRYCSAANADQPFYEWDFSRNDYALDADGNKIMRQWKSYDNKPVRRVPVKQLSDNRLIELLCSFKEQVDPIFEMNMPNTWFCDIETEVTDEGFPSAEEATTRINTISMTQFPRTIIWSRKHLSEEEKEWVQSQIDIYSEQNCEDPHKKDITKGYKFEFREFDNERDMLADFVEFIKPIAAIAGWNFLGFDWLYIYNRCKFNCIDIDSISPTRSTTVFKLTPRSGGATINVTIPMHKIIYDYMLVFKTWDMTVEHAENHTLDYIAYRVLSMKKVPHQWGFKEFFEDHFKEYVFYNCIDTILIEQMDKQIKTAEIWNMLASILRIEANDAFSTIKPCETVLANFEYPLYKVFTSEKKKIPDVQEKYEGAFVIPVARAGIYSYIGGLDFASLYPSIIRQFGISPETFLYKKDKKTYVRKDDEIVTASGAVYKKDKDAMMPAVLTHYYGLRKAAKNDMKQADTERQYFQDILDARLAAAGAG